MKGLLKLLIIFFLTIPLPLDVWPQSTDNSDIGSLVRMVRKDMAVEKRDSLSMVLDFLTNVYGDHDFYQSGNWDENIDLSYIEGHVKLPPYDPSDFYRPVMGRITSNYGYRPSYGKIHKGVDLSLNMGDTVRAALPGVIARIGYDAGGYGRYVVMVHNNGLETRYAHLKSSLGMPGDSFKAGQPIAIGGSSGNSTGPHLHFEVRYRGSAINPLKVFDFHRFP